MSTYRVAPPSLEIIPRNAGIRRVKYPDLFPAAHIPRVVAAALRVPVLQKRKGVRPSVVPFQVTPDWVDLTSPSLFVGVRPDFWFGLVAIRVLD